MKLAFISDIHGNPIALDAVLVDIEKRGGVNGYQFVGDYAALGYDPIGVLEQITNLPNATFVRGNTDRFITTGKYPDPHVEDALEDSTLTQVVVNIARSFAWTQGCICATGWFDWLAALPLEHRFELPDGTRVLIVHAAPGHDDGDGIRPNHTDDEVRTILKDCKADLIVVGHTHIALDRIVDGIRVVKLGSVSNPHTPDLRASYAMLEADESNHTVKLHRVDYDRQAVIQAIKNAHHAEQKYLIDYMLGKNLSELFQEE